MTVCEKVNEVKFFFLACKEGLGAVFSYKFEAKWCGSKYTFVAVLNSCCCIVWLGLSGVITVISLERCSYEIIIAIQTKWCTSVSRG